MQTPINPPSFRNDINGLRAWAVVAVVLYHFGIPGFGGGFVGVDIFFVISGFLMTGIVLRGLERDSSAFSILDFYAARARRILPALVVLCAALLAAGWWVLPAVEYKKLGTHAAVSLAFLSNLLFWRESGYFDIASHDKWLLHTWSLAVEWQFYLLLPVILAAVWKIRPQRAFLTGVIATGFIASLIWSITSTHLQPTTAFFLLPTRAWEMLAGGLVFIVAGNLKLNATSRLTLDFGGIALLVASIAAFDSSTPWPGWHAIVPVIGTAAVLLSSRTDSIWTCSRPAQWLGTRSYSLYLWHWPIAVALVYLDLKSPEAIIAGLLLTAALGDLSYRLVETPSRRKLALLQKIPSAAVLIGATSVIAACGTTLHLMNGIPGRLAPSVDLASRESLNRNPRLAECHASASRSSPSCRFGGENLRAVVIGDSHANALLSAVVASTGSSTDAVMEWTTTGCPTIEKVRSLKTTSNRCGEFVDWVVRSAHELPRDVPAIIINRHGQYALGQNEDPAQVNTPWVYFNRKYATAEPAFLEEYARNLIQTACTLAKDRQVYLVRPIPEMGVDVPKVMARTMARGEQKDVSLPLDAYEKRNGFIWAAQDAARVSCGVKILNPIPYLCADGRCEASKDGRPLYFDDDHLSEFGNKLLVPMFAQVFLSSPAARAAPIQ